MKNIYLFAVALVSVFGIISCNNKNQDEQAKDNISVEVSNFEIAQTIKTAGKTFECVGDTTFGKDTKVYSETTTTIQWLTKVGDNDLTELQDSLLSLAFNVTSGDIDSVMIGFVSHPQGFKVYKLNEVDSLPLNLENIRILSDNVNARIKELNKKFIVYQISYDSYSGGAHPSYAAQFLNYDIKNNKILEFDNIFKSGSDTALYKLIEHKLCERFFAKDLKELEARSGIFIDELDVSHNLYLTDNGITFFYNPYEIGPWAIGVIEVEVPYYDLINYLNPSIIELYKFPQD